MAQRRSRYKQLEQLMLLALTADVGLFVLYLIIAGAGIVWLKVFLAVLCFLISGACLALLFLSKELLRPRSLWMTCACAGVVLVLLLSLILNYPCPNPRKLPTPGPVEEPASASVVVD